MWNALLISLMIWAFIAWWGLIFGSIVAIVLILIFSAYPITQMFLTLLSGFAQMERSFISERTKSALQARKAQGQKLGRQKGQQVKSKYDEHKDKIKELCSLGLPVSKIVNYIGTGTRQSLTSYIQTRALDKVA